MIKHVKEARQDAVDRKFEVAQYMLLVGGNVLNQVNQVVTDKGSKSEILKLMVGIDFGGLAQMLRTACDMRIECVEHTYDKIRNEEVDGGRAD